MWMLAVLSAPGLAQSPPLLENFDCSEDAAFGQPAGRWGWFAFRGGTDPWTTEDHDGVSPTTDDAVGGFGGGVDAYENFLLTGDATWNDAVIETTATCGDNDHLGLVARFEDAGHYYMCALTNDRAPSCVADGAIVAPGMRIYRVNTDIPCADDYVVASDLTFSYSTGVPLRLRLRVEQVGADTVVTCTADRGGDGLDVGDDLVLQYTDTDGLASGQVGLASFDNGEAELLVFDDVRVQPLDPDQDLDGATDAVEAQVGTDPKDPDSDDDGLLDGLEIGYPAFPYDTDGDGFVDAQESDSDDDTILDGVEAGPGLVPFDTDCDGLPDHRDLDSDNDGVDDRDDNCRQVPNPDQADEDLDGVGDVCAVDTDGDGLSDSFERQVTGTNPDLADTDGDGLDDGAELRKFGTDPLDADTDGGGVPDGDEVQSGTNPLDPKDDDLENADPDGDGLVNADEDRLGTDPLNPDTDSDGLLDGEEVSVHGTDPLDADSDGGGLGDGDEVAVNLDPLDPSDDLSGEYLGGPCVGCQSGGAAPFGLLGLWGLVGLRRRGGQA
ncbi:MAG: hypothetical protein AAGA48_00070 [Myxococcota bacterium]